MTAAADNQEAHEQLDTHQLTSAQSAGNDAYWTISKILGITRYRWFVLAFFLDQLCDAIWMVTLGLVVARTDTHWAAGAILLASGLPLTLTLVLASGWIDRKKSHNVALVTLMGKVVVMLTWAVVITLDAAPFAVVAILGGVLGALSGLHEPAMVTYPTALLPAGDAQSASMVVERGGHRLTQAFGGVVAGWLIGIGNLGTPALFAAVTVTLALLILTTMARTLNAEEHAKNPSVFGPVPKSAPENTTSSSVTMISGGLEFIRSHPVLPLTLPVQTIATMTMAVMLMITLPFRARNMHWGPQNYGIVFTVYGIGMTIATLAGWYLQRLPVRRRVLLSCGMVTTTGLVIVCLGGIHSLTSTVVMMGLIGLCLGPAGPFLSGYLRGETAQADKVREAAGQPPVSGRASAVMMLATDAVEPLAYLLGIVVFTVLPLATATVTTGAACLIASSWYLWRIRSISVF